jgi:hypothetical protein
MRVEPKKTQIQICAGDRRIRVACVVLPVHPADGGDHQQNIPDPSSGYLQKEDPIFSELGRITLVATGWATVHTSRSTCGGRHPGAGDAVGRHHPHGHGLQARGPGGEASKGTEQRGEEGYAEDMGEMPRVAGPTPSSTPMT